MSTTTNSLNIAEIRKCFPILEQQVNGKPLIYLDNAATTQKPQVVLDALSNYYSTTNANIHRGIHSLAEKATIQYEDTRIALQEFIGAKEKEEIIFTRGTTESINLVAATFGKAFIKSGDEIIISQLEHHSNIVPWQLIAQENGAIIKVIPINELGELEMDAFDSLLSNKTKLVAVNHASNALGTINPVKEIIDKAHVVGAKVLVDGAQSTSHIELNVQELDVDFYAISAHKMYGPTGVGALYGKRELLEAMPPYQGGGEMIKEVSFAGTTYADLPYKFEAGTPNIASVIAFKSAIDFIDNIGRNTILNYEHELLTHATSQLEAIAGLRIIGTAKNKVGVASFIIEGVHHQDLAILLDHEGIAVRTGHHCTQPLMECLNILGTTRASFAVYNTIEEIDSFIIALNKTLKMLR